jgi:hypothetical protein
VIRGPTVFGLSPQGNCWWCGGLADSQEHRFKHSSLRRVAGGKAPRNVFKKSDDYSGELKSISKGSQVRWPKNLCSNCNNARSQPFDYAYDTFEDFLFEHGSEMGGRDQLEWSTIYGRDWAQGAANLARYFGKQMGCMLATQDLPVPGELISFLDGAERCPSACFMLFRNWRGVAADRLCDAITAVETASCPSLACCQPLPTLPRAPLMASTTDITSAISGLPPNGARRLIDPRGSSIR